MDSSANSPTPWRDKKRYRPRAKIHSVLDGLTDRDVQICRALWEFRVLTTHQIFEFFFSTPARARKRLIQLYRRGIITRFRPPTRPGSHPQHYVLDELGAKIVAGYLGIDFKELGYRRDRVLGWSRSQRLSHLREANDFWSRLSWACTRSPDHTLALSEGEASAGRRVGSEQTNAHPDGLGVLDGHGVRCVMALELDRGTETVERLVAKLRHYDLLGFGKNPPWALLFCLHSERREANVHKHLYPMDGLVIATNTLDRHLNDPLGANWLPVRENVRYTLLQLPSRGTPSKYERDDTFTIGGNDDE